jgi:hypothetical protein
VLVLAAPYRQRLRAERGVSQPRPKIRGTYPTAVLVESLRNPEHRALQIDDLPRVRLDLLKRVHPRLRKLPELLVRRDWRGWLLAFAFSLAYARDQFARHVDHLEIVGNVVSVLKEAPGAIRNRPNVPNQPRGGLS